MLRRLTTFGVLAAALVAARTASAQAAAPAGAFGDEHQAILSVDRLMPLFAYENQKQTNDDRSTDSHTVTSMSFVTHGIAYNTFYNIPRFAFDYTVWSHLTVGGSIFVSFQLGNSTTHTDPNGVSVTNDNSKITYWGLAPRVGYILQLSDLFAFWPRGGFSFNDASTSIPVRNGPSESATLTQWALDLEPIFVITPVQHVGFTIGGAIDIPFAGSISATTGGTTVSLDQSQFHFGITGGMLVWF